VGGQPIIDITGIMYVKQIKKFLSNCLHIDWGDNMLYTGYTKSRGDRNIYQHIMVVGGQPIIDITGIIRPLYIVQHPWFASYYLC
jgi:hypothetical protein